MAYREKRMPYEQHNKVNTWSKQSKLLVQKVVLFPSLLTVTLVMLYTKVVGIVVEVQRCLSHS